MFEILNKLEKKIVLSHTNRKSFEKQVISRELRRLTADVMDWASAASATRVPIKTREEKMEAKRGPVEDRESSGLQFPIHELLLRK